MPGLFLFGAPGNWPPKHSECVGWGPGLGGVRVKSRLFDRFANPLPPCRKWLFWSQVFTRRFGCGVGHILQTP